MPRFNQISFHPEWSLRLIDHEFNDLKVSMISFGALRFNLLLGFGTIERRVNVCQSDAELPELSASTSSCFDIRIELWFESFLLLWASSTQPFSVALYLISVRSYRHLSKDEAERIRIVMSLLRSAWATNGTKRIQAILDAAIPPSLPMVPLIVILHRPFLGHGVPSW